MPATSTPFLSKISPLEGGVILVEILFSLDFFLSTNFLIEEKKDEEIRKEKK